MSQESITSASLLDELTGIVSRAAAAILAIRASALAPRAKADQSPVTAADEAAEALILAEVARVLPGVPIVSEESSSHGSRPPGGSMIILVDPVDGTRELVAGRDEFTVNLAIVAGGQPSLGIIAAPARGLIWRARIGGAAERIQLAPGAPAHASQARAAIRPRPFRSAGMVAAVSRSHCDARTEALLERIGPVERMVSGSALKFCHVAQGLADIYPRLSQTREWDVAAGHAILSIAGGVVTAPDGRPLAYGTRADFVIPAFIAWGDPAAPAQLGL